MKYAPFAKSILLLNFIFFSFCSDNLQSPLVQNSSDEIKNISFKKNKDEKLKKLDFIQPEALEYGTKIEYEYIFDHFSPAAGVEFGIVPTENEQMSLTMMNELHDYWGFNYVLIPIGSQIIVSNAIQTFGLGNIMAGVAPTQAGKDQVQYNTNNGLTASDSFWAYYIDEPASVWALSSYGLDSFENFIRQVRPNSLFGFGETSSLLVNNYISNTIIHLDGSTSANPYPVNTDFVMCTKYLWNNISRWDSFRNTTSTFSRTWIHNLDDFDEFYSDIENLRDNGISPWLYVSSVDGNNRPVNIYEYCLAAHSYGLLNGNYNYYKVYYSCTLNHVHNPLYPENCNWVEDYRQFLGVYQN